MPLTLCAYIVELLIFRCIYNKCVYVCLLPVYREAFLPIVF